MSFRQKSRRESIPPSHRRQVIFNRFISSDVERCRDRVRSALPTHVAGKYGVTVGFPYPPDGRRPSEINLYSVISIDLTPDGSVVLPET